MELKITKDGSIQGWVVSCVITFVTLCSFIAALLSDKVADRFMKVGDSWAIIVIGQFGAWIAYRGYTSFRRNGGHHENKQHKF